MLGFHSTLLAQMAMIDVDRSLFINWLIFIVTTIVVYYLILKPILKIQELRHTRTAGAKEEALAMDARAQKQIIAYEALLAEASQKGKQELQGAKDTAMSSSNQTIDEAKAKSTAIVNAEMPKIQATYDENKAKLEGVANTLSDVIVARVVNTEASA